MLNRDYQDEFNALYSETFHLIDTLYDFLLQNAAGMTCNEADTMSEFMQFIGLNSQAVKFIEAHSLGDDDEGDLHQPDNEGDT